MFNNPNFCNGFVFGAVVLVVVVACDPESSDPKSPTSSQTGDEMSETADNSEESAGEGKESDLTEGEGSADGSDTGSNDSSSLDCDNIEVGGGIGKGGVLADFMFPDHEGEIQTLHQFCEHGIALVLAAEW